jgi:hypothetical protein
MAFVGDVFLFDPPPGWSHSREGARNQWTGPEGQALMVSGYLVGAEGSAPERDALDAQHLGIVTRNVTQAVAAPDLEIIRPLGVVEVPPFRAWYVETIAPATAEVFLMGILHTPGGVLLVSFEGPDSELSRTQFWSFFRGVRATTDTDVLA